MNIPEDDAKRLDEFIQRLSHDPNAPVPARLDPDLAEFARLVVLSERTAALDRDRQARIWQRVRSQFRADSPAPISPGLPLSSDGKEKPAMSVIAENAYRRKTIHRVAEFRGVLTVLAAALILIVIGVWLLLAPHIGHPAGQPRLATSATAAATAAATEPATRDILAPSLPSAYVAWSPRGDRVAVVGGSKQEEITLWSRDGRLLKTIKGHSGFIAGLAWSPDGAVLASGGSDNSVRLWTPDGDSIAILSDHTGRVDSLMWSPDASMLASAASNGDGTIRLWTAQGQPILTIRAGPTQIDGGTRITWSPDGKRLSARYGDNTADIWSLDGTLVASFGVRQNDINDIQWSPDSARVAVATMNSDIQIYTADGKPDSTLPSPTGNLMLRWSPDGRFIAALSNENIVRCYDVRSHSVTATIIESGSFMSDLAFSPDGRVLATTSPNKLAAVKLWDLRGKMLASYPAAQDIPGGVMVGWSPDGRAIATWMNGVPTPQIVAVDDKVLAQAVETADALAGALTAAATSTSVPQVASGGDTPSADGNAAEQPLVVGQTVTGTITEPGQPAIYTGTDTEGGVLLVLLQSDDLAVGLVGSQIGCIVVGANGGGGGGGGGGSGETGGSPEIRPFVVDLCPKGQISVIRLSVGSASRTETGKFTMSVYRLVPSTFTMGQPIDGEIGPGTPYQYYPFSGAIGDVLTSRLNRKDGAKLSTMLIHGYLAGPNVGGAAIDQGEERYILGIGSYGLLVLPAVKGAMGRFSLTLTQEKPPMLGTKVQSVTFDAGHTAAVFAFAGSDKPLVLKAKITSGSGDVQLDVMPALALDAIQSIAEVQDETNRFTVTPTVPSSFKLATVPDRPYIVLISPPVGAESTLELSLSAP
jgi:Tol biopolymer transport system component